MKHLRRKFRNYVPKLLSLVSKQVYYRMVRNRVNMPLQLGNDYCLKLAETEEEYQGAYHVLHDAYVDVGYAEQRQTGLRVTKYHALGTTYTMIVTHQKKVVGTCSLIARGEFGIPMDSLLSSTDNETQQPGAVEVSSLAVEKSNRNKGEILFLLVKGVWLMCGEYLKQRTMYVVSNPETLPLYEGVLCFDKMNEKVISHYSFVNGAPAVLLRLNIEDVEPRYSAAYNHKADMKNLFKFIMSSQRGGTDYDFVQLHPQANPPVISWEHYKRFFIELTDTHNNLTHQEKWYLMQHYGHYSDAKEYFDSTLNQVNEFKVA